MMLPALVGVLALAAPDAAAKLGGPDGAVVSGGLSATDEHVISATDEQAIFATGEQVISATEEQAISATGEQVISATEEQVARTAADGSSALRPAELSVSTGSSSGQVSMTVDAGAVPTKVELFQAEAAAGLAALAETAVKLAVADEPAAPGVVPGGKPGDASSPEERQAINGVGLSNLIQPHPISCDQVIESCTQRCNMRFAPHLYDVSIKFKSLQDFRDAEDTSLQPVLAEASQVYCAVQMCIEVQCTVEKCKSVSATHQGTANAGNVAKIAGRECAKVEEMRTEALVMLMQAGGYDRPHMGLMLPACRASCGPQTALSWTEFMAHRAASGAAVLVLLWAW